MDIYKTRCGAESRIINRRCPIDRSGVEDDYSNNGFAIFRNALSHLDINGININELSESKDIYTNYEEDKKTIRSLLGVHSKVRIANSVPCNILSMVRRVLGSEFYIHQSRINVKNRMVGGGWTPHSDFETWHYDDGMENMRAITVMIALDNNTISNGCLNVMKGSHKYYFSDKESLHAGHDANFTDQKSGVVDKASCKDLAALCGNDFESVELAAGDAIIFDCNLLHKSSENKSSNRRRNLFFVLNSVENRLLAPFSGGEERPQQMAHR